MCVHVQVYVDQQCHTTYSTDANDNISKNTSSWQDQLQLPMTAKQKHVLVSEYVALSSSITAQPSHGAAGQMHAVWTHKLSRREKQILATGEPLVEYPCTT